MNLKSNENAEEEVVVDWKDRIDEVMAFGLSSAEQEELAANPHRATYLDSIDAQRGQDGWRQRMSQWIMAHPPWAFQLAPIADWDPRLARWLTAQAVIDLVVPMLTRFDADVGDAMMAYAQCTEPHESAQYKRIERRASELQRHPASASASAINATYDAISRSNYISLARARACASQYDSGADEPNDWPRRYRLEGEEGVACAEVRMYYALKVLQAPTLSVPDDNNPA